jgi:hypothetical protein
LARIDGLSKRLAAVEAESAALRDKLNLPPKTPDNSSTPPSQNELPAPAIEATVAAVSAAADLECSLALRARPSPSVCREPWQTLDQPIDLWRMRR